MLEQYLQSLAEINVFGAPFLFSYGVTWLICGILWKRMKSSQAAIATLFQGMFALPVALFISFQLGALENRPQSEILNHLSILIAMSQLLVLPLLIAMYQKKHYTLIPFVFSGAGAVHFILYTWLYQTPSYIVMALLIALALAIVYGTDQEKPGEMITKGGAAKACLFTGITLLGTALYFITFK